MIRILCFTDYYLPGFKAGGPIVSISNLIEGMGDGYEFLVVTRNHDLNDSEIYRNIKSNQWNTTGKAKVFYLGSTNLSLKIYWKLMLESSAYDVIYFNSFFSPRLTIVPLLIAKLFKFAIKKPVIIATHGEFSPNALNIKWLKKIIYLTAFKIFGLDRNIVWHASTTFEAEDIKRTIPHAADSIYIAKNSSPMINKKNLGITKEREPGALRMVFLSRVSRMKNLDFFLRILKEVKSPVNFSIYGPIEDLKYWAICLELISQLPDWIIVKYNGEISRDKLSEAILPYDLFVLPTLGENYGHVIIESLSFGTPVLISDKTSWESDLSGGVTVISLDSPNDWITEVERWTSFTNQELTLKRTKALEYVIIHFQNDMSMTQHKLMFNDAISKFQ